MIKLLLNLLEKIPYRTKFGLSIADELKVIYYHKIGKNKQPEKCLCGGKIITRGIPPDGWETSCYDCDFLYDED
jgi:hypothetical protein